jgi:hypothetical protein
MLELEMNGAVGREAERAVGERSEAADGRVVPAGVADPELVERPARRRFSAEYKLRVLREADACSRPGEVGALLRREAAGRPRASSVAPSTLRREAPSRIRALRGALHGALRPEPGLSSCLARQIARLAVLRDTP